jgi:hypothetical protein
VYLAQHLQAQVHWIGWNRTHCPDIIRIRYIGNIGSETIMSTPSSCGMLLLLDKMYVMHIEGWLIEDHCVLFVAKTEF